jgi:hypothetical protein
VHQKSRIKYEKKKFIMKLKLVLAQAIPSFFLFSAFKKRKVNAGIHALRGSLSGLTNAVRITRW